MSTRLQPRAIQALIFDLDGLLVDSEPLTELAITALFKQHGCQIRPTAALLERVVGRRIPEVLTLLAEICGLTVPVEALNEELEARRLEVLRGRVQPCAGASVLLAFANNAGLRLALGTSGRRQYVDAVLGEVGFRGCFEVEVTGDDVACGKPAPDVYLLAADRLRVAPARCVVFEDAPAGIAAAMAAGMRAVAVPNVHTQEANFTFPPEVVLPELFAAIPWLQAQGIGADVDPGLLDRAVRGDAGRIHHTPIGSPTDECSGKDRLDTSQTPLFSTEETELLGRGA